MTLEAQNLADLPNIAKQLLTFANNEKIFVFEGEMGAGKTTFIKSFCETLGVTDVVSSPTFSIVNEYKGKNEGIYHFDFYRIKNLNEAFDLGYEEYFYSGNICLIEWPEKVTDLLPDGFIKVKINIAKDNVRIFTFSKH